MEEFASWPAHNRPAHAKNAGNVIVIEIGCTGGQGGRIRKLPRIIGQLTLEFWGEYGGAWPFLVGGVICLLNCDNERDLNLLNSQVSFGWSPAS